MRSRENTPKPLIQQESLTDAWNDRLSAVFSRWHGAHWVFAAIAASFARFTRRLRIRSVVAPNGPAIGGPAPAGAFASVRRVHWTRQSDRAYPHALR